MNAENVSGHPAWAIVLFGSPGAGKGTQAKLLSACLRIPHISTGDMLRERIRMGGELGAKVAATLQSGMLVSDELIIGLVDERLKEPDCENGFILDGYPRTRYQAEDLVRWLDARGIPEVVIHLVVDYNKIITRLTGRRQCPRCGSLYNVVLNPPKMEGVCDRDGETLVVRDDDRESVVRERLEAYETQTRPLLEYFREAGRQLHELPADGQSPEALSRTICRLVSRGE